MNASPPPFVLARASAPDAHLVVRWSGPFADAVAVVRRALTDEKFLVLHEIDTQRILAASGHAIAPLQQLLFFHPIYMVELLSVDPAAIVDVPLKAVIAMTPRGDVDIRILDPAARLRAYPGLERLGGELSAACARIIASVTRHEAA